jgi:hypothetical protein
VTPKDDSIQPRLAAILAERRRDLGEPPSAATLSAYLAGDLSAEDRERVREHVAADPVLAEVLLDLAEFERDEPAQGELALSEDDLDARWRRMQERLGIGHGPAAGGETVRTPPPETWAGRAAAPDGAPSRSRGKFLALAALLAVAVGVGGWMLGRMTTPPSARAVMAEVLSTEAAATRGAPTRVEIPEWAERLVLVFPVTPPDPERRPEGYRIEIARRTPEGERPVLTARGELGDDDTLTQVLSTAVVPPGRYTATVHALEDGRSSPLGTYRFAIVAGGGSPRAE